MVHSPEVDEKLVFVIMPFRKPFDEYYEKIIRPALVNSHLTPLRADEIYGTKPIISDIWSNIRRSRMVIADVSGRNPNVNYELGLAHACGKPTVILARTKNDVPFDYQHLRWIAYNPRSKQWADKLRHQLTENIKAAMEQKHVDDLMWAPEALGMGGGISIEELMARESVEPEGRLQRQSEVIVQTPQPIEEVRLDIAARVRANIEAGLKYTYILDLQSLDVIGGLIANLVSAPDVIPGETHSIEDIEQSLTLLQNRLRVYVVERRWPFRFCIHNPRDAVRASLCLQDDEGYAWIEWLRGKSAYNAAKQLREDLRSADKLGSGCIRGVNSVLGEEELSPNFSPDDR